MKKIIYSLVIMIAAGSLFTSCIEQVEPLGIQDMRFAKAEYIRALKDLRAADAELVRAEAAHEQARARYVDAMTANLNADTEYQKLLNEYQQLLNEARQDTNDFISQETANKIDSIKKRMELRELEHAKKMADAEQALALAEDSLRVALRNIALSAQSLTEKEKNALANAAKAYEIAFTDVAKQEIVVLRAQRKVDSLEALNALGDTVWDKLSGEYLGQLEYWKEEIKRNELKAALYTALLVAAPDSLVYDDVDGWKEQIDQLYADSTEVAYDKYQISMEMANYYTNYIHDGVNEFNNIVKEFKNEYWDNGTVEPKGITKEEADTLALGEPIHDVEHFPGHMDTIIVFPDLLKADFNLGGVYYDKLSDLLKSYKDQQSPVSKVEGVGGRIMIAKTSPDTLRIQKANQSMKAFILGAEGDGDDAEVYEYTKDGKTEKIYADYGLKGALAVLKRIYKEESAELKPEETAKDKRKYDSIWVSHNSILKAGLTEFSTFKTKKQAYETAKANAEPDAMFSAMKELYAQIGTIADAKDITAVDSAAILAAIEKFAKVRDAYLDDANNGTGKNYKYAEGENHHFFYFATKTEGGKAVLDSVSFAEIATQTKFDKAAYQWDTKAKDNAKEGTNVMDNVDGVDANGISEKGRRAALNNILNQLFNTNLTAKFNQDKTSSIGIDMGTDIMGSTQSIIPGSKVVYTVDSWENPTVLKADGATGYEPKALTTAKEDVFDAIAKYNAKYNSYWNKTVHATMADVKGDLGGTAKWVAYFDDPTDADALKDALKLVYDTYFDADLMNTAKGSKGNLKDNTYTAAPFDAFTKDEAPLVLFNGINIVETPAIDVVLESVDPEGWVRTSGISASAILNYTSLTASTDFYKRMYYRYRDWRANHPEKEFEQDTKRIEDWIAAVEKAFADDAAKEGVLDEAAYTKAKAAYDRVFEKDSVYQIYATAKKAFTGVDKDGKINEIVTLTAPVLPTPAKFADTSAVHVKELLEAPNVFGVYPGTWSEKLGGEQLAAAQELFPDYPETFSDWVEDLKEIEDQCKHYTILIDAAKDAYFAAAKIAGENVADTTNNKKAENWDELVENYKQANERYRNRLRGYISEAAEAIDINQHAIAKFEYGAPIREVAIAVAKKNLTVAQAKLDGYKQVLDYAKANLDKLLEYLKSLDVNFAIVTDDDVRNYR